MLDSASVSVPLLPNALSVASIDADVLELRGSKCKRGRQPDEKDDFRVADIRTGAKDSRGEVIRSVFHKRPNYAIFESGNAIRIQFSDDETQADQQVALVAPVLPLRHKLQFIAESIWQIKKPQTRYSPHIAEAYRLSLEGQAKLALETMQTAISDASDRLAREGRLGYIMFAGFAAVGALILAFLIPP